MASPNPGLVALANAKAAQYGVPPHIGRAVISAESGWNPAARSPVGAIGLMQIMPGTARGLGVDPTNVAQNIDGGMRYLGHLFKSFNGNARLAVAAYNAGPAAVTHYGGIPPYKETQSYVQKVLAEAGQGGTPAAAASSHTINPKTVIGNIGGNTTAASAAARAASYADLRQQALSSIAMGSSTPLDAFVNMTDQQNALPMPKLGALTPTQTAVGGQVNSFLAASGKAGGFLPKGQKYIPGRLDQGHDFQTNAGGAIIAPGAGTVVSVHSDPHGFGPSYPTVHFTSGPYKGRTIYIGHTLTALKAGAHFKAGQIISRTGRTPIGNASVPGWAEIGYAPGGAPGSFGQKTPF